MKQFSDFALDSVLRQAASRPPCVNASLGSSKEVMGRMLQDSARKTVLSLSTTIDAAPGRIAAPIAATRQIGMLNILASCITLAAAVIVMGEVCGMVDQCVDEAACAMQITLLSGQVAFGVRRIEQ